MQDFHDLVTRIALRARAQRPLPPVVPLARLRQAEHALGFALPPLLAALYTRVADGGFGPGGDVAIPGYDAALLYPLATSVEAYHASRNSDHTRWPQAVIPMLYWGCFGEAAVDCLSPAGTVLMYESDVDEVSPDQAWKVDAASLEAWWETWLAGETTTPTQIWRR